MKISEIAAIVRAKHGGFATASDGDCLRLWHTLDDDVRKRYLAESGAGKKQEAPHADAD